MSHTMEGFILGAFDTHLGANFFGFFGAGMLLVLRGGAVLVMFWLILYWMYKERIFIRI